MERIAAGSVEANIFDGAVAKDGKDGDGMARRAARTEGSRRVGSSSG